MWEVIAIGAVSGVLGFATSHVLGVRRLRRDLLALQAELQRLQPSTLAQPHPYREPAQLLEATTEQPVEALWAPKALHLIGKVCGELSTVYSSNQAIPLRVLACASDVSDGLRPKVGSVVWVKGNYLNSFSKLHSKLQEDIYQIEAKDLYKIEQLHYEGK